MNFVQSTFRQINTYMVINMAKDTILLVEKSEAISKIVTLHLINAGYAVSTANNPYEAMRILERQCFSLIILEILLPDSTSYDLCKKIRESIYCPVIFISSLDSEEHVVKALELGGDDYIIKPVRPKEIVARVKANLRRVKQYAIYHKNPCKSIRLRELTLDMDRHTVSSPKKSVRLTPLEFKILSYLLHRESKLVSYRELFENAWEVEALDDHRAVKVHVSNIKNKIKIISEAKNLIINIRGEGYVLRI